MTEIVSYFETVYIGSAMNKARFEPTTRNATAQVQFGLPKSNNYVEGFNNRMKHAIGSSHPSLPILIDALKKEHQMI